MVRVQKGKWQRIQVAAKHKRRPKNKKGNGKQGPEKATNRDPKVSEGYQTEPEGSRKDD